MGDFAELPFERGIDVGMTMPVQVRPDGGIGIEILAAVGVAQQGDLAFDDDDRLAFEPVLHLRERMPYVLLVKFGERVHGYAYAIGAAERHSFRLSFRAAKSWATSSAVCAAVTVRRKRARPRATVG